jgi:hypothetical protein
MTDIYLRAATEATMNAALIAAGLAYEEDGNLYPAPFVSLDVIGPITRVTGYDENGDPITVEYPEWHVNVRCNALTEEQEAEIEALKIVPPEQPFRVWA